MRRLADGPKRVVVAMSGGVDSSAVAGLLVEAGHEIAATIEEVGTDVPDSLKPGMTANLQIVVGRRENALLVPAMAVQQGEEGNVVLVQDDPEGPGVATPVEVGLGDGVYVEVLRGLNEGDRVMVQYQATQDQFGMFGAMGAGAMRRMTGR